VNRSDRAKIKRAIRLILSDSEDGLDLGLRILMPMVGMRRPLWDMDGADVVPMDEIMRASNRAALSLRKKETPK